MPVPPRSVAQSELLSEDPQGALVLSRPDMARVMAEDRRKGDGLRFAVPVSTSISLAASGEWREVSGGRVWLQKLQAPGAKGIAVEWQDFLLPQGATLHMYEGPAQRQVLGAYTSVNNRRDRSFLTGIIHGDQAWIEYFEPNSAKGQGHLVSKRAYYAYENALDPSWPEAGDKRDTGFGTAWDCMINVNCPEGQAYQAEKRSACRILLVMEEGLIYCSGTVMNNAEEDGKPYVLSAHHCHTEYTPKYNLWRFDFNYEAQGCSAPASEPGYESMLGCQKKAGAAGTDFLLLLLDQPIPISYHVYFAGWNRSKTYNSLYSAFISHPSGDIKKIALDEDSTQIYNAKVIWNDGVETDPKTHYLVKSDKGLMQSGSSGCGLLDKDKRIIGQLHGGVNSCQTVTRQLFGILAESWDREQASDARLKDWLDPKNKGVMTVDGTENPPISQMTSIRVKIQTPDNKPIVGLFSNFSQPPVTVQYEGDGVYRFDQVQAGTSFSLVPQRISLPLNGLSSADLVLIQKHILNKGALGDPYRIQAGDVNLSGDLSAADLVQIQRLLLNKIAIFPNVESWVFDPPLIEIPTVEMNMPQQTVIGVKMGDVNFSRDPAK